MKCNKARGATGFASAVDVNLESSKAQAKPGAPEFLAETRPDAISD
jgi:hypothetical protein